MPKKENERVPINVGEDGNGARLITNDSMLIREVK
jgi:hypothetical protein